MACFQADWSQITAALQPRLDRLREKLSGACDVISRRLQKVQNIPDCAEPIIHHVAIQLNLVQNPQRFRPHPDKPRTHQLPAFHHTIHYTRLSRDHAITIQTTKTSTQPVATFNFKGHVCYKIFGRPGCRPNIRTRILRKAPHLRCVPFSIHRNENSGDIATSTTLRFCLSSPANE